MMGVAVTPLVVWYTLECLNLKLSELGVSLYPLRAFADRNFCLFIKNWYLLGLKINYKLLPGVPFQNSRTITYVFCICPNFTSVNFAFSLCASQNAQQN